MSTFTAGAPGTTALVGVTPKITIAGTALAENVLSRMVSLEVVLALGRPGHTEIRFQHKADSQGTPADDLDAGWVPGKALKVQWGTHAIFDGEITGVDVRGGASEPTQVVLVAHDKCHRLYRHDETKSFKNVTYSDVLNALIKGPVQKDFAALPTTVMPFFLHQGTAGDLIDRLCAEYGLYCIFEAGKVSVKKATDLSVATIKLRASVELLSYQCRQSTSADNETSVVRGWDPKAKAAIIGKSTRAAALAGIGTLTAKGSKEAFSETQARHEMFVGAVNDANAKAKGLLAGNVDASMQLDATCRLQPQLVPGKLVEVAEVPKRFVGRYRITSVTHYYDAVDGGVSEVGCRGGNDVSLPGILQQAVLGGGAGVAGPEKLLGVYPAEVKHVKSVADEGAVAGDGGAGEVRVQLHQLGDEVLSGWLRVVTVGGGKDRGLFVMPEPGDEVLVVFEGGDPRRGYVLGGLYNGQDAAPRKMPDLGTQSTIDQRLWRSRSGHEFVFSDKNGDEHILIHDKTKKNSIKINTKDNKIIVMNEGDVEITTKGAAKVDAQGAVSITTPKDVTIEGNNVKITAKAGLNLEGATTALKGKTTSVQGTTVEVKADTALTASGTPIKLN